jgi:hypothetical protein
VDFVVDFFSRLTALRSDRPTPRDRGGSAEAAKLAAPNAAAPHRHPPPRAAESEISFVLLK